MCGIAGYIYKKGLVAEKQKLKTMTDAIKHRGPDAEGQWSKENIGLGHRRLAIIDLNQKSNQPMISHDGRFVIVFNGEVYNYIELKEEIQKKGAIFVTNSDTEVIMETYRYHGVECFNKFNGMWALCIYDQEENKIVFSRDRYGIKPLYVLDRDDVFAFASEVKAITAAFPEENVADEISIYRYISGAVKEDADERSYYKNIKIFRPAKYMIYDVKNNSKEYGTYWKIDEALFKRKWLDGRNPLVTFRKLFEEAIRLRLRADVEVGACLSGGIDSSTIVGCAADKYKTKMHTFSSIYEDKECNEEKYINLVNKKWNTSPHYIRPDEYENEFTKYMKKIIHHHDGPTAGASLYSQYMVMKKANEHVKVVLDGQGADELFGGYIPYYSFYIEDLQSKDSILERLKAISILTIVNKEWPEIIGYIGTDLIVNLVGINNVKIFQNNITDKNEQKKRNVKQFTEDFLGSIHDDYKHISINCSSKLNSKLCEDTLIYSIPALLHNEDSNSMAFSIESRVPFLDYRIVEFAIALDGKYKIKNSWTKWIIRKTCKKYLPKEVRKRKNKMGFPAPFARWLREGKNKDEMKDIILAFGKRNIVPMETIKELYNSHISGEADVSSILFKYYSMELWLRTCNE